jgi:uroporphyrinogen-III synthase
MSDKASILSTMPISREAIDKAAGQGIALHAKTFIKVSSIVDSELDDEILELCHLPITAVFTSVNGVKAVAGITMNADPVWNIYCIGNATMDAANSNFNAAAVRGMAKDAESLAKIIIADAVDEVVLFCGDKRMDVLPDTLRESEIMVYEVVVYRTVETPHIAAQSYDGILFFSPSAADSFFSVNTIGPRTILFAIGATTANAIKKYTDNKVIVSETASKEVVAEYAVQYFLNNSAR